MIYKFIAIIIITITTALPLMAQNKSSISGKLPSDIKKIIIDDCPTKLLNSSKNQITIYGDNDAIKTLSAKTKKGVLSIFPTVKAQVFLTEKSANISKNCQIDSVIVEINSNPEYITINNNGILILENYKTKRTIIKATQNSFVKGNINCDALGLTINTGSESKLTGNFRTTKIVADSAKLVFTNYHATNSELLISGGSIVTIEGETSELKLNVKGLSRLEALQLKSKNTFAEISEQSDTFFNTTDNLNIKANGKSHIVITGNPKTTSNISSDCKFRKR